jgi:hypothetical protein
VNVLLCRPLHACTNAIKKSLQIWREGVFETGREGLAGEFLLDRNGGLFPPYREFLIQRLDAFALGSIELTVGTVRNMTTSCS